MNNKKFIELLNDINDFLYKNIYEEISFATFLKVEDYLHSLKEKLRLEEVFSDRSKERNYKKTEGQG